MIPAYNEASHLPDLIEQISEVFSLSRVIIVDDGSSDNTRTISKQAGVTLLHHDQNLGKGRALSTGFEYALRRNNIHAVITIDADLQHDTQYIPKFIELYSRENFDLIVGWRSRNISDMPFSRILTNSATSFLLSIRSGMHIRDSQCGFRLLSRQLLENIHTNIRGFQAETEIVLKSVLSGYKVGFLPVSTIYTTERSYIKPARDVWDFLRIYGRSFFWNI